MQRQCRLPPRNFAIALALLAAAGCAPQPKYKPKPSPPPRWPGVAVRVAAPEGPARRMIERHGKAWSRDTGATMSLVAPDAASDAVVFAAPNLASRVDRLRPMSEVEGLLPLYRSRLLHWAGKSYALPLLGDGVMLVYRADLYDAAGLKPPTTWDEVADHAAAFAAKRKQPSLPPPPSDDAALVREFSAVAAPFAVRASAGAVGVVGAAAESALFSFEYDLETGKPRLAQPGFVAALELLRKLQPFRSARADALASGEAVLGVVTLEELSRLPAKDGRRWGVARVPGSRRVYDRGPEPAMLDVPNAMPVLGGGAMLGAVTVSATAPEAALDLLTYLSGEAVSLEVIHEPEFGGGPFRDSHLTKREDGWFGYGLSPTETVRLRETMRELADPRLDNPALCLRVPGAAARRTALAAAVRAALGDADAKGSLEAAAKRWEELDGDSGKAREEYRRSLGLGR